MGGDDDAVAEQPVLRFLRQRRGTAAQPEHQHLMGARHQLGGLEDILGVDAALDCVERVARFAEHDVP